jgi:putative nucleotidyltransferase with HDIG domain
MTVRGIQLIARITMSAIPNISAPYRGIVATDPADALSIPPLQQSQFAFSASPHCHFRNDNKRPITDRPAITHFRRIDAAVSTPFATHLELEPRGALRQSHLQEPVAGLIRSLIAAMDAKDPYTRGHSERVARIALELGRELELPELELANLYFAGLLHDVGKIGVPDHILCKRDRLTPEEIVLIRQHVLIGCRILHHFGEISHLVPLVLHHHERYDGHGYPYGLSGEAIPPLARILAVADSYDAMNTSRSYRTALPRERIEQILEHGRNRQWDGKVVDAFFRIKERIDTIHPRGIHDSLCYALRSTGDPLSPGPASPLIH